MNRQQLEYPENTAEYQDGIEAKQLGLTERACPWGLHELDRRCRWLAGYHDTVLDRREAA
ncbi:hypothetical protein [Pseudomonas multiresinivorans]|uniref:Ribosome modulation factor n=1 Tax=Pseudomonas multiresinivorans TaxID=95301 RepID=A0A7Z3BP87_9PSED|nr:hypothetical protein [Pseudomonas multiresinivorans]QJP08358.1 hypothetical protein G4G71_10905 [Pseudomonas multiresinivorans]QJP10498.1 hypothetical protein G4G71_22375 [Pseudomonas multiresinivorans]